MGSTAVEHRRRIAPDQVRRARDDDRPVEIRARPGRIAHDDRVRQRDDAEPEASVLPSSSVAKFPVMLVSSRVASPALCSSPRSSVVGRGAVGQGRLPSFDGAVIVGAAARSVPRSFLGSRRRSGSGLASLRGPPPCSVPLPRIVTRSSTAAPSSTWRPPPRSLHRFSARTLSVMPSVPVVRIPAPSPPAVLPEIVDRTMAVSPADRGPRHRRLPRCRRRSRPRTPLRSRARSGP